MVQWLESFGREPCLDGCAEVCRMDVVANNRFSSIGIVFQ